MSKSQHELKREVLRTKNATTKQKLPMTPDRTDGRRENTSGASGVVKEAAQHNQGQRAQGRALRRQGAADEVGKMRRRVG